MGPQTWGRKETVLRKLYIGVNGVDRQTVPGKNEKIGKQSGPPKFGGLSPKATGGLYYRTSRNLGAEGKI